jgi:hypothetical protein
MKGELVTFVSALLVSVEALILPNVGSGVLHMSTQRRHIPTENLRRRALPGTLSSELVNKELNGYIIKVRVGTPPQEIGLLLDSGSSDSFMHSKNSTFRASETFPRFTEATC